MSQENKARLDFFQLSSPATKENLDKFRPTLLKHFDQAVDEFYGFVAQYPHLKEKFKTDLTYVKGEQKKHWMNLFSGTFPAEYFEKAQKIGFVHSKVNLEPTWYVGGYAFFLSKMAEVIISNFKGKEAIDIMKEVIKVSLVDMELALTYYIKSSDEGKLRNQLTLLSATLMDASQYATTEVMGNTEKLINLANEMTKYIDNVGRVSEENLKSSANSSEKINAVVSTSRELSAAIKEISDQVGRASHITNEAVEHTNMANDKISELVDSANTIGEVIKMINKIASQTNLLALNATIEAARAGEAGRGFAVVASEVKNLANQTEKATQEITAQVSRIQDVTNQTFEVFKNVGKTVNEVSQISTIISGAVEEQNAATSEIASHIENVSTESLQNQERAKQVQDVAAQTSEICKNVKQSAELIQNQMSDLKNNLQGIVKQSRDLDRRTDFRTSINADGRVRTAGGNVVSVKIMDLTETGAKTSYFSGAYLGAEVDLDFPGIGFIKGMVRHIEHNQSCGIELKSDASQRQQIVNYLNGIEKRSAA